MSEGNGESGVTHIEVPVMTITVDPRSMAVSFKCSEAPIAFWQMVVGEVSKQLEEQRRAAAAIALNAALRQQAADAHIAEMLKKRS